ncbi:uncharacterized protein LOC130893235 [Diorhabda carinulata]|uniref:uncharacterized protein LOC130893235 n=1 Tax=Diorhabda carinulata TaxID=1163345 RepID=UPI0025A2C65C|nr:uncharacterized protein LOC130893235 [Diorhabda carinulata]
MDSFVCKIVIVRSDENRILKPKNYFPKTTRINNIKRCLFGVAKIEDTDKMLQEQYDIDRKRFSERFGIDLKRIEESERDINNENVNTNETQSKNSNNSATGRKILKRNRSVFRQQNNQTVLTDFYQARKTVQSLEKSSKAVKEN